MPPAKRTKKAAAKKPTKSKSQRQRKRETAPKIAPTESKAAAEENLSRDAEIYRAANRGLTVGVLIQTYGLSQGRINEILAEQRERARRASPRSPLDWAHESLDKIDEAISELAGLAAQEKGSTRITAVSVKVNALFRRAALLERIGLMPTTSPVIRFQLEGMDIARKIMEVLDENDLLTDEVMHELQRTYAPDTLEGDATEIVPELNVGAS